MGMFDKLLESLAASRKTIVFTEGTDARILDAAARILKEDLMGVILCGNVDEVKAAAAAGGYDIDGAEILDPLTYGDMEALVAQMVELRKGKMTEDEVRELLKKSNYFGTMLVKAGKADALLGGATYSTADTVRPALQIIKTKPGSNLVSSSFILFREKDGVEERIAMGDCAINLAYTDRLDKEGSSCPTTRSSKPATSTPISSSTASSSSTPQSPRKSRRPSAPTPRSPARPTPSSSRSSRPATSATRSRSVSAAMKRTAPSFRV